MLTSTTPISPKTRLAAAVFAAMLTASAVATVPAPVSAASPELTAAQWQARVERQIDGALVLPANALAHQNVGIVTVALDRDADGAITGAHIAKSSGDTVTDEAVLRTARSLRYPRFPQALRASSTSVVLQIVAANDDNEQVRRQIDDMRTTAHLAAARLTTTTLAAK